MIGSGNLQLSSIVASDKAVYACTLREASLSANASLVVYGKHFWLLQVVQCSFMSRLCVVHPCRRVVAVLAWTAIAPGFKSLLDHFSDIDISQRSI